MSLNADDLFSVQHQVVLVSGGTRGIGRAIAAGFAARGAQVILTGREAKQARLVARELAASGAAVEGEGCDVSEPSAITSLVERVSRRHQRIDTLVNVAGVNRRKPTLDVTEEDYDHILAVNLKGAFLMAQAAGRIMTGQGQGSQIHVSSLNNDRPLKHVTPYAMSKAALGQMTRALAMEWGPRGVRVNALAPGFILTDLTQNLWAHPDMRAWGQANTPLGRLGQPEDMVGTALFLASNASAFLSGQVLYVDGGFTAGWSWPIPEGGAP